MSFQSRSEFINAQASEKITLAHVTARQRILPWTLFSGTTYVKTVNYYVTTVHNGLTELTLGTDENSLNGDEWYYDPETSQLYINVCVDPATEEIIATYRLFYSSAPIDLPWNLEDTGVDVHYQGRIQRSPGYKHKIGVEQNLISIIGNGSLKLINTDGGLDEVFDTLIFDNQEIEIYSWHRDLSASTAKRLYRGRVTNKRFQAEFVTFQVKDQLFDLEASVNLTPYDDTDNVADSIKGRYKRWIYGRVDGLQLQSVDQIAAGYTLTGTLAIPAEGTTLTGTGTLFLSELSPGDQITVGTQEFEVDSISSDTSLEATSEASFAFTGQTGTVVPEIPTVVKNREFFVAGHASAEVTTTVVDVKQFNRVEVTNTSGFEAGDFAEFAGGDRIEIRNIAPGNILVLRENLTTLPAPTSSVVRQPIQKVFIESTLIPSEKYTISNLGAPTNETKLTLDSDIEFTIAPLEEFNFDATFTNGTRTITTTDDIDLREILKPRDYIRPTDISFTNFYEILDVDAQTITLRTNFTDPNHTGAAQGKKPEYVGDDTIVSANVLGRTVTGEPAGTWIETSAQAMRDLLTQADVSFVNETSFTDGASEASQTISLKIPFSVSGGLETYKQILDKLAKTTNSVLTLDNNLDIKYKVLNAAIPADPTVINDFDVIDWSIETVSGKNIRNVVTFYRHKDIDRFSLESGTETFTYSSDFVEKYIGTNQTNEVNAFLYGATEAEIFSHRYVYYRSIGRTDIKIETDLRLEDIEIGEVVILDFNRLYKRFGDASSRKKVAIIIGKTLTGERTKLELTDLGNLFNRSSIITPNSAPDYVAATEEEKLKYGYITDGQGIVEDEEDTANIHSIS